MLTFYVVPLASSLVSEFFDQGYLVLPKTFGEGTVARFRRAFSRLERRAQTLEETTLVQNSLFVVKRTEPTRLRIDRIVWCGGVEPLLGRLGRSPKLVEAAAELLGAPELDQLVNQAHIKNPGDGLEFRFHQDSYHRRYGTELFTDLDGRGSFVQTLTAMDAMDPENGGLYVVPESHRLGHIPTPDGRLPEGSFDASRARADPARSRRHAAPEPLHGARQRAEPRHDAAAALHQRFLHGRCESSGLSRRGNRLSHPSLGRRSVSAASGSFRSERENWRSGAKLP